MYSTIPPAHRIAAPHWEAATVGDLLDVSAGLGVPACALYRIMYEPIGGNAQDACDCR